MVMRGIDISNWQSGLDLRKMPIDFCIMKATEGLNFVDSFCDGWVQQAKKLSMPWGFYHFARENDPVKEAEFFVKKCKNYFGLGVPVLDYETTNSNDVTWCEKFLKRVYDLTGVWPLLYISSYRVGSYSKSWIPSKCGLWIAGYPTTCTTWPIYTNDGQDISHYIEKQVQHDYWLYEIPPYDLGKWECAAIWQFSSEVILPGYVGKLDGNLAYMDESAWSKYAKGKKVTPVKPTYDKSIDELACEVIEGKHGNGAKRKKSLGAKFEAVQKRVDELYTIADEVIAGKWGNGETRKKKLKNAGYPYELVQKIVNDKLA